MTVETEYPQVQFRRGSQDGTARPRRGADEDGPTLRKLMAAGERRLRYLDEKLDRRQGSTASLSFDLAERLFLREAIRLMELYHSLLSDEHNPAKALRAVLYQLEELGLPDSSTDHDELRAAVARARTILANLTVE